MNRSAVSPRVADTVGPAILEARTWLAAYDGSKGAPLDLSQAAPPYPPPNSLLERLSAAAASADFARYGPVQGEPELRAAYARHASEFYDANISPEHVAITGGCNQAFFIATMLIAQRGDAIILPSPWYFNHKMTFDMLGIEARPLPCAPDSNFIPDVSDVERSIEEKVRAVVLVSPNNPTGAVYPAATIEAIAALCRERGIWLILDETYRDFLPEVQMKPHSLFAGEYRDNIISLYSFSKSLALPGYRLGAMIYPPALGEHAIKVQDCIQICPSRVGQVGVTWALDHLQPWRDEKKREMAEKARSFAAALASAVGWRIASIGAYFAYLQHPRVGTTGHEVARRLAAENGLLVIPGSFFGPGQDSCLRLSFGNLQPETLGTLPERLRL